MFSSNTSQVSTAATYIEDVFSTWLYTGNSSTQTITNGIDLSTYGGLVWLKNRGVTASHYLMDSARSSFGARLSSNTTGAQVVEGIITSVTSTGFNLSAGDTGSNGSGSTYASWTFRKQPKFFDVVTFTTASDAGATVAHSLGSTPGFVIVKGTSDPYAWICWHRGLTSTSYEVRLNNTAAQTNIGGPWLTVSSTEVVFAANTGYANLYPNTNYVMYVFAHNAGGFGLTGTDNVISCGSFQDNGSGTNLDVTLGYEPQWLLVKTVNGTGNWLLVDSMRGFVANPGTTTSVLRANLSNAESTWNIVWGPTATGFQWNQNSGLQYIYIAIRRGPMKTPTSGTSVFSPVALNGPGGTPNTLLRTTGFPVDLYFDAVRNANYAKFPVGSRLQGKDAYLATYSASQENFAGDLVDNFWDNNTGISITDNNGSWNGNFSGQTTIMEAFRRAPGFCDVVCYTGNDVSARAVNHNLGVAPELVIVKARNDVANWPVYASALGNNKTLYLNLTNASATSGIWGNTTATSSYFYVGVAGDYGINNATGLNYVAYLFASCPGVSKVGSYTGTGALQTINCGFTGGARFVLIKRTDSTGDWYVYDSARGISNGNDPYLLMNSNSDEVTGTNYVDTTSVGFQVTAAAPAGLNASGGTYLFLAIS